MKTYVLKATHILVTLALLAWLGALLTQKIDLTTADLGRHIKNGELWLSAASADALLHANFYSYTQSEFPFINHHWGSGVLFHLIRTVSGFAGLSWFYILLGAATLLVFFDVARKASNVYIAAAIAAIAMPLVASRAEVRPEMITYFLSGVFFWFLWLYRERRLSGRWLWLLPVLMLAWANLHIGFFFGIVIIGVYWTVEFVLPLCRDVLTAVRQGRGEGRMSAEARQLTYVLLACVAVTLVNPNFFAGAVYPLDIFKNYGYTVVENQSVRFLERLGHTAGLHFTLFKTMFFAGLLSFAAVMAKDWRRFSLPLFLLFAGTAFMAYGGIRNFPFFGFFLLPAIAHNIRSVLPERVRGVTAAYLALACALAVLPAAWRDYGTIQARGIGFGTGLLPGTNASAEFFKQAGIKGPVFNNYDIGGYLIYHLYPMERVFVDNRPEAYSVGFLQDEYIKAQQDDAQWQELQRQWGFNAIFFSHRDFTPWGQQFLISRVQDSEWVPVYADSYNILFVKDAPQNAELIKQYGIPRSRFGVVPN